MSFAGVSFIGDGKRPPALSASSTTVADSGYHLLVVDGYSRIKQDTPNGEYVESRRFRIAGYRWFIRYYPNGILSEDSDCISLYLQLDDDDGTDTHLEVQFEFSFVDKAQKQVPLDIRETEVCNFGSSYYYYWGHDMFMTKEELEKSTHLKDDSLTIKCDVVVTKDVNTRAAAAPFIVVPASDMHQHLTGLLQSGEGTDVTFEVGAKIFAAHRVVLASRSKVFKAEIFDLMKEATAAGAISIEDMDAGVFAALLFFIYSDSEPEIHEQEDDVMWQKLLVAAQKYDLLRLRLMCEQKLCTYITTSNVATILVLAELHHCKGLKEACLDFLESPSNVQEVMVLGGVDYLTRSCPAVMKELVAKLVSPKVVSTEDSGAAALPFVVVPASDMHLDFTSLLQSGDATDVTFQVDSETFTAHRCVLAARSSVFRAELFGPMKEGTTTSLIPIEDMEANVFKLMLTFIYSDSMPKMGEEDSDSDDMDVDLDEMWQQLLTAADRYDLQRLKLICEDQLCGYIDTSTVATILALAEKHQCRGLKEKCMEFLDSSDNLQEVLEDGGLDLLKSSCPSILIDLISKLASLKVDN